MSQFVPHGMGWQPELFDPRDFTLETDEIQELTRPFTQNGHGDLEPEIDLREFFPAVEDQGPLGASCAFAVLGLMEYFEGRHSDPPLEGSRLFLHQMTLRLRGTTDDGGTDLRTTLKALRRFGVPGQRQWPYLPELLHRLPTDPFLFCFADEYQHIRYFRIDRPGTIAAQEPARPGHDETLKVLKCALSAQLPFLLGFFVPATLSADGLIYDLNRSKNIRGGQAVIVVGYNDKMRIASHRGALLIRNSWGRQWGQQGYGWLPYDLLHSQAVGNVWMIVSPKWADSVFHL